MNRTKKTMYEETTQRLLRELDALNERIHTKYDGYSVKITQLYGAGVIFRTAAFSVSVFEVDIPRTLADAVPLYLPNVSHIAFNEGWDESYHSMAEFLTTVREIAACEGDAIKQLTHLLELVELNSDWYHAEDGDGVSYGIQ